MNKRVYYLVYLFTASIVLDVSLMFLNINLSNKKPNPISPLPNFLTVFANDQATTLNLWYPSIQIVEGNDKVSKPDISASSAILYDLTTDKILYSKNPQERLPMASLTKIMTAIVALENKKSDDKYLVSKKDLIGEDMMGLSEGEILSLKELLYGLMLHSGNDAAEVLASNFSSRGKFIRAMNNKVKSLGLKNTHFTNPTGLEGDGQQYTTTYDLLVLTKYALQFPLFLEVASTFDYHISSTNTHKEYYLENETNLLTSYVGVLGVKTGYTPEAGLCLVTYLNYNGHQIIGILLNSDNRRQEMKDLLDYGLKIQDIIPPPHS